jgi:hypothetical protein
MCDKQTSHWRSIIQPSWPTCHHIQVSLAQHNLPAWHKPYPLGVQKSRNVPEEVISPKSSESQGFKWKHMFVGFRLPGTHQQWANISSGIWDFNIFQLTKCLPKMASTDSPSPWSIWRRANAPWLGLLIAGVDMNEHGQTWNMKIIADQVHILPFRAKL